MLRYVGPCQKLGAPFKGEDRASMEMQCSTWISSVQGFQQFEGAFCYGSLTPGPSPSMAPNNSGCFLLWKPTMATPVVQLREGRSTDTIITVIAISIAYYYAYYYYDFLLLLLFLLFLILTTRFKAILDIVLWVLLSYHPSKIKCP